MPENRAQLGQIYREYPYDFVRHIEAHSEILDRGCVAVMSGDAVLDLGCGIGLFAERLIDKEVGYTGIDISKSFIQVCRERYGAVPDFEFRTGNINQLEIERNAWDVVVLINVLYQASIDVDRTLEMTFNALRSQGRAIVSGPCSIESYARAEPQIRADLERKGLLEGNEEIANQIREANRQLLTPDAHYWSLEGMVELLMSQSRVAIQSAWSDIFYGNGYLVLAEKR